MSSKPESTSKTPRAQRWLLISALTVAALVATYAALGFLVVPWYAKRELPRIVDEKLKRDANVAAIEFNPFTLRLKARDFSLNEQNGRPILGFREATAALEWRSLFQSGWVLTELHLIEPSVHVDINENGTLNLAALAPPAPKEKVETAPVRYKIGQLRIENGSVDFEDRPGGYKNRLERISLELSSLSTFEKDKGPYTLTAVTPGGAKIKWKGELALQPFGATGTITLEHAALPELNPYVAKRIDARIISGRADFMLPYKITFDKENAVLDLRGARLKVSELALAARKEPQPFAKLASIELEGIALDLPKRLISLKALRVGDVTLIANRDADGGIDLVKLLKPQPEDPTPPWNFRVAQVELANGSIAFADRVTGLSIALERASAKLSGVSSVPAHPLEFQFASTLGGGGELKASGLLQREAGTVEARIEAGGLPLAQLQPFIAPYAKVKVASGELALAGNLRSDGKTEQITYIGTVKATNLALHETAGPAPFAKLASLELENLALDIPKRRAVLQAVRVADFSVAANRDAKGEIDLEKLIVPQKADPAAPAWNVNVGTVALTNGGVSLNDRASGFVLALERASAKLSGVSSDAAQPVAFEFASALAGGGQIKARGRSQREAGTLETRLEIAGLPLAPLQRFIAPYPNVKIASGELSLAGDLRTGGKYKVFYTGSAAAANVAVQDSTGAPLIGWKSLATNSMRIGYAPNGMRIDELRLVAPAGKLAIAVDQTTNISRALKTGSSAVAAPAPTAEAQAAQKSAPPPEARPADQADAKDTQERTGPVEEIGDFPIIVRRVRVDQGTLDFSDDSLKPGFAATIQDLAGAITGISTDRNTRSQFALEGRVDEFGYARLSGSINAFAPRDRTNLRVEFRNLDVTKVTPYAMKFAGYRIASGRLTLDLNYRVSAGRLEGDNKILLEKFALGERVESPTALKLPLELAIALLKDADGRIEVALPISGNLDDPQFDYRALIGTAISNLFSRILSAPFRALASVFGGSSEAGGGAIAFAPGASRLLPPEREKIARIAEALAKRGELQLKIPGRYDMEADGRALKRAALKREIEKRAGLEIAEDETFGVISIEDRRTRSALRALFRERFSEAELDRLKAEAEAKAGPEGGKQQMSALDRVKSLARGEPQVADPSEFYRTLGRRLVDAQPLAPTALEDLAKQRATTIADALKAAGADPARVSASTGEPAAPGAKTQQVTVQLTLSTR